MECNGIVWGTPEAEVAANCIHDREDTQQDLCIVSSENGSRIHVMHVTDHQFNTKSAQTIFKNKTKQCFDGLRFYSI